MTAHDVSLGRLVDVLNRLDSRLAELDLDRLTRILDRMDEKLAESELDVLNSEQACKLLNCSVSTLDRRRKTEWIEGVHWWRDGHLKFDRALLLDWQRNRFDPVAHMAAVEHRRKQQLGLPKRKRKAV